VWGGREGGKGWEPGGGAAENEKNEEARAGATEGAAEGGLAQARATSGEAQKSADEVERSTETLQRESERNQTATPLPQSPPQS